MFRLSDLQLVLLHAAATRADGSLLPPPESIGGQAVRIRQSIGPLLGAGYVVERLVTDPQVSWRSKAGRNYGVFISEAGRLAVGVPAATPVSVPSATGNRIAELLQRDGGMTLFELARATGERASTVLEALRQLMSDGCNVRARYKCLDTRYRIVI